MAAGPGYFLKEIIASLMRFFELRSKDTKMFFCCNSWVAVQAKQKTQRAYRWQRAQ
jgi:hypothetical protein